VKRKEEYRKEEGNTGMNATNRVILKLMDELDEVHEEISTLKKELQLLKVTLTLDKSQEKGKYDYNYGPNTIVGN